MQGLWPVECSNNVYPGLDKLVCLACHPDQPLYTQVTDEEKGEGVIRICDSLLRQFYGNDDMNSPTEAYE